MSWFSDTLKSWAVGTELAEKRVATIQTALDESCKLFTVESKDKELGFWKALERGHQRNLTLAEMHHRQALRDTAYMLKIAADGGDSTTS